MTSGGGLTTLETAAKFPIRLVESGPAGGAILARNIARQCDLRRMLSFDMGGTTAKLCLIDDFQPQGSRSFEVDRVYRFKKGSGLPVRIPVIEMVEIGAGGGSLARVDKLQRIQVGPQSAGSDPGPAAYGRGGPGPAVTDADVRLGRIYPPKFAGGEFELDIQAANLALQAGVAAPLDIEIDMAAFGISEVVDENMAAAARAHAAEFGLDLGHRDMVAFGGAAPLHAARLGDKLGVNRIIVPTEAGVGSAVGFLLAPVAYEVVRSRHQNLSTLHSDVVNSLMEEMREEALAVVRQGTSHEELLETRQAYMRYVGQGHEIAVDLPVAVYVDADAQVFQQAFEDAYVQMYGRTIAGVSIEVLSWTLTISAPEMGPREMAEMGPDTFSAAKKMTEVRLDEENVSGPISANPVITQSFLNPSAAQRTDVPVYLREHLQPGECITGPALIAEDQTTTVITSHYQAVVDERGYIVLTRIPDQQAAK
jgi:N-methylhydantoinase A